MTDGPLTSGYTGAPVTPPVLTPRDPGSLHDLDSLLVPTPPAEPRVPWPIFTLAVAGRVWLALIAGAMLISALPTLLPGWSSHVVISGSMEPRINVGDVVVSQDRDDYRPGQVIVFDSADRGAVTHRLQAVDGDVFTTKGDANPTPDSTTVDRQDVIGLGRILVMFVGLPWVWYHTGQWLPLGLLIASVLLAAWAISRDRPAWDDELPADQDPSGAGLEPEDAPDPDLEEPDLHEPNPIPDATAATHSRGRLARRWWPRLGIPVATLVVAGTVMVSTTPSTSAKLTATSTNASNNWTAWISYASLVQAASPSIYLRLNETTINASNTAADNLGSSGTDYVYTRNTATSWANNFTAGAAGSANLTPTPNTAVTLKYDGACILAPNVTSLANPQTFTIEAWIRTTDTTGGKIVGFENSRTGQSDTYDRHLYLGTDGKVRLGLWTGSATTIASASALNDNAWHHVVGTLTAANGTLALYVDGALAGSLTGMTAQTNTGWWRFGCGNLNAWPSTNNPTTKSFLGSLDEVAVYTTALTAAQVLAHYNAGRP